MSNAWVGVDFEADGKVLLPRHSMVSFGAVSLGNDCTSRRVLNA